MKNNENKKIIKESQNKLSPTFQRKKYFFSQSSFKNNENNNILLSPKRSQYDIRLPKKKIIPNTSHHRRKKSNSDNYIQYMTNNNINLNQSASKLSFIFRRNDLGKNNINNNYSLGSRNKKTTTNFNDNKKKINLLSISFSLKDFRNTIMNAFSHSNLNAEKNNKKNKIINLKNNKSLFKFDNTNIEETRNTTSITCFNNSNLIYNKSHNIKEDENSKSTKYIKINLKSNNKLLSPQKSPSKIITYTNSEAIKEKKSAKCNYNIHNYIYKNNINRIKNYNKLNNTNNLILTKKTFRNSQKNLNKVGKSKKIGFFNPINELENNNFNYIESERKNKNKNINNSVSSANNRKNKNINKERYLKYKKRKTKSQDKNYQIGVNDNYSIKEFKSVEEIHFIYVQINQRKKEFFKKNNIENKNKNNDKFIKIFNK